MERTPEEWRDVLLARLAARRPFYATLRAYYSGDHDLPTAPTTATDTYRRLAQLGVTNMCGLVVDTVNERLRPRGVRLSTDAEADTAVWRRIWQGNNLDADWSVAQEEALKVGRCPVLVWADDDIADQARVTVEDADEVIVAYAPGSRRKRVAALKAYVDDGVEHVTVWTATEVRKWTRPADNKTAARLNRELFGNHYAMNRTDSGISPAATLILPTARKGDRGAWQADDDYSGRNPIGRVPVTELLSKPSVSGVPMPELSSSVLKLQDRINKTMFDAVVAAEYGAFPQRYAIDVEVTRGADGTPVNPLTVGPNRVWLLKRGSENAATIGQLDPFPLEGLLSLADASIKHLASISQTPVYYLLSGLTNVGADSIRAAETGHVAKIINHQTMFGDAAEEMFRMALAIEGSEVSDDVEVDWAPPETRSPAELADAAIKLSQAGYPFLAIARYMGESPAEIERLVAQRDLDVARVATVPVAADAR